MEANNSLVPRGPQAPAAQQQDLTRHRLTDVFPGGNMLPEPSMGDYFRVLLKRKWTVLVTLAIAVCLAGLVTARATRLYESSGRISINPSDADVLNLKDSNAGNSDGLEVDTQVRILQSDAVALESAKRMRGAAGQLEGKPLDAAEEAGLIGTFRSRMTVVSIPDTRIIEIRYLHTDPQYAAAAVNTIAAVFIEQNFKTKYDSTMRASDWLTQQLTEMQTKVQTADQKLVDYQRANGIVGVDEKTNITMSKLDDLNKQMTEAQTDRIQRQAIYEQAKSGDRKVLANTSPNMLVERLRQQESDLQTQLAQLTTQFGPSYPKVLELNNQLKQVQSTLETETTKIQGKLESEYLSAMSRERMLSAALEKQKQAANALNEKAIQYTLLKRDADSTRQIYEGMLAKQKEAVVTAGLRSNTIRIVDPARVPVLPSHPNVPRNMLIGFLFGLTAGIALAFVQEMLDNTVKTPEEVTYLTNLPALGMIPLNKRLTEKTQKKANGNGAMALTRKDTWRESTELVSHSRPKSEIAEAYRALRTSILLSSLGAPPKCILVTSALPQEGKTTTCINIAIVLAQKGAKVLLVDADMRRPSIHNKLALRARGGLSTLLTGSDTMANVLVNSTEVPNLHVLPAGPPPPHPAELLGSTVMKSYILEWREKFDHVIIDSPPCLSVTDAVLLSVDVDAVALVLRSGQTPKDAVRRARNLLFQVKAKVLGVVVNAVDMRSPDMYYYSYASKYGSYYTDSAE
ncbi:MAG: polysaccharide biosynthesis tyrosine autokinase [Candidatus Koribacter versatilis]|uniref:non-specific protein-tyrosine kinase n=1 Tax=Candidatus Korobacter versatilis TaxID=658062 RepID=A0A932A607_9BACT|nr:polysaccharide biosynthesis tyrosine autokinase [Candidatus Koribacter versatilis]